DHASHGYYRDALRARGKVGRKSRYFSDQLAVREVARPASGQVMGVFFSRKRENKLERSWAPRWWAVFLVGLLLWIATVATAFFTGNLILLPTIVLIGSFLVPVTGVTWYLDHDPSPVLTPNRVVAAFIIAGVVGALAASLLEFWLVF